MGRRVEQPPVAIVDDVEAYYRCLARRFLHVVEGRGEEVCEAVLKERDRIDRTRAPIAERMKLFEVYLEGRGLLETARRFADQRLAHSESLIRTRRSRTQESA